MKGAQYVRVIVVGIHDFVARPIRGRIQRVEDRRECISDRVDPFHRFLFMEQQLCMLRKVGEEVIEVSSREGSVHRVDRASQVFLATSALPRHDDHRNRFAGGQSTRETASVGAVFRPLYSMWRSWPGGRGSVMSRGKSGLHRAGCWVTPRRGDPRKVPQKQTAYRRCPRGPRGEIRGGKAKARQG